ncbi:MAG: tRNA (guanosine(37)-N1)-methyltransferase TrmD [Gammaproteobacteria bacterium]|nr:tRNA (guanosine(37)-N1)-methyltransferase TrmD [Gammaproteobacteria bacterium]
MRFGAVSIFPGMFDALRVGITGRAIEQGLVSLECWDPRDYATDRHRTVDDRPYGGGPGMVMRVEPLQAAIRAAREHLGGQVVYMTPQGRPLTQATAGELAEQPSLIWVCGRYEGIDERLIEAEVDVELSIGDYVISGGELAAMVAMDAIIRLLPGALGHEASAEEDSFVSGLLDCPHYTRPEVVDDKAVPEVLMSGDHGAIRRWRLKQSLGRTWLRRPELIAHGQLDAEMERLLEEFIGERE